MKTTLKIFGTTLLAVLFTVSISSCSNAKEQKEGTKQEACCEGHDAATHTHDHDKQLCCQTDENALMIMAALTIKNEADKAYVENALHQVVDGTNTEEGNISYILHQDINNPMRYVIFEVWKSQEAIDFHNQTPHFKAFQEAIRDKVEFFVITMKKAY